MVGIARERLLFLFWLAAGSDRLRVNAGTLQQPIGTLFRGTSNKVWQLSNYYFVLLKLPLDRYYYPVTLIVSMQHIGLRNDQWLIFSPRYHYIIDSLVSSPGCGFYGPSLSL